MGWHQGRELARSGSRGSVGAPRWAGEAVDEIAEQTVLVRVPDDLRTIAEGLSDQLIKPEFALSTGSVAVRSVALCGPDSVGGMDFYAVVEGREVDAHVFGGELVRELARLGGRGSEMGLSIAYLAPQPPRADADI